MNWEPGDQRPRPEQVHALEQKWSMASEELDKALAACADYITPVAKIADLNAFNPSFAFDGIKMYMLQLLHSYPPQRHAQVLYLLSTAALTRLVCAPHTNETDDILAQLEKGMKND